MTSARRVRYRSDWPEAGLHAPLADGNLAPAPAEADAATAWTHTSTAGNVVMRWIGSCNAFESALYDVPIWELHVEATYDGTAPTARAAFDALQTCRCEQLRALVAKPPSRPGYVCSKVVAGEPLHAALLQAGFAPVESRRLFRARMADLLGEQGPGACADLRFTTLAALNQEDRCAHRAQLLDLCREAFGAAGFSRHFTDPHLFRRRPGLDYILAVMQLNFERLRPADFVVAVDDRTGRIVGFSVVAAKPGLTGASHTQLLSAVAATHRGRGVYRGLTRALARLLPGDATLLNVTHVANQPMQRAYALSGRTHLADTLVMRRMFD